MGKCAIDEDAADRVAVSAQVFGQAVHHDIDAVLDRPQQRRRRSCVIDDHGYATRVGNLGDARQIGDRQLRIADRLQEHSLGAIGDGGGKGSWLIAIHPYCAHAMRGKVVVSSVTVPPYRRVVATISSPMLHNVLKAPVVAAWPLAKANPATPPSRAATRCSRTRWSGS